jgi:hypothetical protein
MWLTFVHMHAHMDERRRRITQQYEGTLETDLGFVIAVRITEPPYTTHPTHTHLPTHTHR